MRTKLKTIPYFILMFFVFCSEDNNPSNTPVSDTTISDTTVSDTTDSDSTVSDTTISDTTISDTTDSDSTVSENGYINLSIITDTTIYTWRQGEFEKDFLTIQGSVSNKSNTVFYSRVGDGFGPLEQEYIFIACNSEGYIEKYNESENSWNEIDICLFLIEGSRIIPIRPSQDYFIDGTLAINRSESETGKYRFRIDYYDIENPDSSATLFQDYSNTFEIQSSD